MKIFGKWRTKWNFFSHVRVFHKKISKIHNGEILKALFLRLWIIQGRLLSLLLFSIILDVLSSAVRQEKEWKVWGLERSKEISLPLLDMVWYLPGKSQRIHIFIIIIIWSLKGCYIQKAIYKIQKYFCIVEQLFRKAIYHLK